MSFMVEAHAYWGYLRLFVLGAAREYIIRIWAMCGSSLARKHIGRDQWNSGWVEFYFQHMYKNIADCFNRPIASAPDACVDVVKRERCGGLWFRPLHDFHCTSDTTTCVNLASYNYLGFGGVDEFCTPAAKAAALESGFSASGTRTEGGTMPIHLELEKQIAEYLNKEDAMVLGMGFATNSTILPALFEARAGGAGVLVLSDKLNHRSIVEGVRLSGATVRAFSHNDMADLEAELRRAVEEGQPGGKPWRKVFVVVEGIYSMEGDFCRLREIVTLKNRYKAYLYLDEAHSIGAVGATGRGVTELLGVPTEEVDVMMGTFTKSFGSAGGYVAASKEVISALRRNAPGSASASAMAPPCAAQALAALRLITGEIGGSVGAHKLAQIRNNANFFRSRLEEEGFKVLGDVDSPIVPVMLHHPNKMAKFSRACLERGIAVVIVGYPAVPVLYERVRFCISASHTRQQLAEVVGTVTEIGRSIGVLFEKSIGRAELAARAELDAAYAAWLRGAPLELRGCAAPAQAAAKWAPEAVAPAAPAMEGIAALALEAAVAVEPRGTGLDVRLFDPLGWSAQPPESARQAISSTMHIYGFGSCGPRGFYGSTMPHIELEKALVRFLRTESAISYSAGCATMSSVLPALVQPGDRVVVDSEVSLGIRTGLRLCRAEVHWVEHGSLAGVKAALAKPLPLAGKGSKAAAELRRTFIIAEALCPRTGLVAPLADLVKLKEEYGALLVLDESLSFGTLGAHGRGLCEHARVDVASVDAIVGSLEHAIAGVGGFCAGRRGLVEHQRLAGAGYCFSAACPPSACSAATAMMVDLASKEGAAQVAQLGAKAAALHEVLRIAAAANSADVELTGSPESYVQHLRWTGAADLAEEHLLSIASRCAAAGVRAQVCSPGHLHAEGAFGARVGAPTTAAASLRFCASTRLTDADIETIGEVVSSALNAQ
jgi:7-keto-8-aminopelargonate synthetase-like enzyme